MTSSSPIFAPIKRVAIPGIFFSFEQNIIETAISFSTNSLEFKTKNKVVGHLTRPLAKLETKLKTHQNTLELSLDSLELLDKKMFLTKSGEASIHKELSWMQNHIDKIQINGFMLNIPDNLMYPMTFNRNYINELIRWVWLSKCMAVLFIKVLILESPAL